MQELIFIIHILAAVFLISLILMQHGKGADMGAAFGSGASQTVFGSIGSLPFLAKITAATAVVFFLTSLGLGYFISKQAKQEPSSLVAQQTAAKLPVPAPLTLTAPVNPANSAAAKAISSSAEAVQQTAPVSDVAKTEKGEDKKERKARSSAAASKHGVVNSARKNKTILHISEPRKGDKTISN